MPASPKYILDQFVLTAADLNAVKRVYAEARSDLDTDVEFYETEDETIQGIRALRALKAFDDIWKALETHNRGRLPETYRQFSLTLTRIHGSMLRTLYMSVLKEMSIDTRLAAEAGKTNKIVYNFDMSKEHIETIFRKVFHAVFQNAEGNFRPSQASPHTKASMRVSKRLGVC